MRGTRRGVGSGATGDTLPGMRTRTALSLAALSLVAFGAGTACSSSGTADAATTTAPTLEAASAATVAAPGVPAAELAKEQGRTVIDVRTPEEYAEGHVVDAENLNLQDPSFAANIAALDTDTTYVVYCRSGNRSATAAAQMRAIGLDVVDGGALTDMADAGWPTS